ncbi:MAG: flagellar biosynthesis anti-sigma factor FlgM [Gammaproteobacteria bacterium]
MPSEISGQKMAIEVRNISSNRTEAREQRQVSEPVGKTENSSLNTQAQANTQSDSVVISDQAQKVQTLISSISEPPAPDTQRIETLRAAINSGTYTVSAESIASKLLTIDFGDRNQSE